MPSPIASKRTSPRDGSHQGHRQAAQAQPQFQSGTQGCRQYPPGLRESIFLGAI